MVGWVGMLVGVYLVLEIPKTFHINEWPLLPNIILFSLIKIFLSSLCLHVSTFRWWRNLKRAKGRQIIPPVCTQNLLHQCRASFLSLLSVCSGNTIHIRDLLLDKQICIQHHKVIFQCCINFRAIQQE